MMQDINRAIFDSQDRFKPKKFAKFLCLMKDTITFQCKAIQKPYALYSFLDKKIRMSFTEKPHQPIETQEDRLLICLDAALF